MVLRFELGLHLELAARQMPNLCAIYPVYCLHSKVLGKELECNGWGLHLCAYDLFCPSTLSPTLGVGLTFPTSVPVKFH